MKKALLMGCLAAWSVQAGAAEFGIGVSVKSDDTSIYVPIEITPKFRIEPSIRYIDQESTSTSTSSSYGTPVTTTIKSDGNSREFAVGVFGVAALGESVQMYYGARGAYIDSESSQRIVTRFNTFEDVDSRESSGDGYRISPTLGFEYLINEHFSIGGEAEWFYQDIDSEYSTADVESSFRASGKGTTKANGTNTRLIVRFRF